MGQKKHDEIIELYRDAESYSREMECELSSQLFRSSLNEMAEITEYLFQPILDIACGTGHWLREFSNRYSASNTLIGLDVSPIMLAEAKQITEGTVKLYQRDMCDLSVFDDASLAGIINFFAIQHLSQTELSIAMKEWNRALVRGGKLILAGWYGEGSIDYGAGINAEAQLYKDTDLVELLINLGFVVTEYKVVLTPSKSIPLDAFYITAQVK